MTPLLLGRARLGNADSPADLDALSVMTADKPTMNECERPSVDADGLMRRRRVNKVTPE